MRGLALVLLVACTRPAPRPPVNVAPPAETATPDAPEENAVAEDVVEHDEARIEQRGRDLYEEARRRERSEEIRAKIRDGRITCTPTGNRIHGPSAVCVEKTP